MSQAPRKLPTERTIAFAAAIVSSKPSDLTVREYITLLNRHVAKGRRENALSAAYRHLDRSAFWRAECERVKDHCRAVEEERLDALREVDDLKAKLEVAKAAAGSGGVKRKRGNADVVPYSREVKKGRKDAEDKKEVFLGGLVIEEVELAEDDGGNRRLMLALYQIGLCYKPSVHVKASTLAFHLTSAAADVSKVVVQALEQLESEPSYDKERLSTTMTAAGRVVAGILAGSEKLIRLEANAQTKGQVTHALVEMYQELINSMDAISQIEANTETPDQPISESNPTPQQRRAKAKGSKRVNIKDFPALNAITCLLSGILKHLDAKQDTHREIFDGFLFCIFSKLGNRMYAAVFSRARATGVEEEIKGSESPVETSEGESTITVASLAVRQAQIEAPYLIHLLKQALALAPAFLSPPDNSSSKTSSKSNSAPKPGSVTKTSLALTAKERLQATLVNAIFGTEGLDEESDLFSNSLRTPAIGANTIPVPRVKEVDVGEWFQGEVWRLLGWEVLRREMDASRRA